MAMAGLCREYGFWLGFLVLWEAARKYWSKSRRKKKQRLTMYERKCNYLRSEPHVQHTRMHLVKQVCRTREQRDEPTQPNTRRKERDLGSNQAPMRERLGGGVGCVFLAVFLAVSTLASRSGGVGNPFHSVPPF